MKMKCGLCAVAVSICVLCTSSVAAAAVTNAKFAKRQESEGVTQSVKDLVEKMGPHGPHYYRIMFDRLDDLNSSPKFEDGSLREYINTLVVEHPTVLQPVEQPISVQEDEENDTSSPDAPRPEEQPPLSNEDDGYQGEQSAEEEQPIEQVQAIEEAQAEPYTDDEPSATQNDTPAPSQEPTSDYEESTNDMEIKYLVEGVYPSPSTQTGGVPPGRGENIIWYSGPASSFPPMDSWSSFDRIFEVNAPDMYAQGDTDSDVEGIRKACNEAEKQSGIDKRVILAMIVQESHGDVGAGMTNNGLDSHGLMQAYESEGYPGQHGLSQEQITSMVIKGTQHLQNDLQSFGGGNDAESLYKALRVYNSGHLCSENLSEACGATDDYVSYIANRLMGKLPN